MFNHNPNLNLNLILSEMDYLNDGIKTTINKLRESIIQTTPHACHTRIFFRSYLLILRNLFIYISPSLKLEIFLIKKVQERQEENEVDEGDVGRIII